MQDNIVNLIDQDGNEMTLRGFNVDNALAM